MVHLSEAPLGPEISDAPDDDVDDDEDELSQELRCCLQAMASRKPVRKLELGGRLIMRLTIRLRSETGRECTDP